MDRQLIFIACGQLTDKEKRLGSDVKQSLLKNHSIGSFLAEAAHDIEDLNLHIFKNLNNCIGFIAILHKRNKINQKYDTSVWINQEIAIIAYLKSIGKKIPSLILLEDGTEQEGLIKYTIANPPMFKSNEEALLIIEKWANNFEQIAELGGAERAKRDNMIKGLEALPCKESLIILKEFVKEGIVKLAINEFLKWQKIKNQEFGWGTNANFATNLIDSFLEEVDGRTKVSLKEGYRKFLEEYMWSNEFEKLLRNKINKQSIH